MTTRILFDNPKFSRNIGTIARTAELLGAEQLIITNYQRSGITEEMARVHATDTPKSFSRIGVLGGDPMTVIQDHKDLGYEIVGVETDTDTVDLREHEHFKDTLYVLGSEDDGIAKEILDQCHAVVTIPTANPWSLNVAEAATILLWDRFSNTKE